MDVIVVVWEQMDQRVAIDETGPCPTAQCDILSFLARSLTRFYGLGVARTCRQVEEDGKEKREDVVKGAPEEISQW